MALELNEIEALTQDFWYPRAYDNYFTGNVLCYRLLKKGSKAPGGVKIRVPIYYGGPHGGPFGTNSAFDTTKYDDHNAARFEWTKYYEPCTYDMDDELMNSGPQAEVDLVMSKLKMMQKGIRDQMAEGIYSDGSLINGVKQIDGLFAMINSSSSTAYGSLTEDDLSEWKPGAVTTTTEALSLPVLRALRTACEFGNGMEDSPTLFITTPELLDVFRGILQSQQRFTTNEDLAKVGFRNIEFEGVPVVSDHKCPDGYFIALNENYMEMKSSSKYFFKRSKWMRPTNQLKYTLQVVWAGNMVCMRRDAHGYHSNLS